MSLFIDVYPPALATILIIIASIGLLVEKKNRTLLSLFCFSIVNDFIYEITKFDIEMGKNMIFCNLNKQRHDS